MLTWSQSLHTNQDARTIPATSFWVSPLPYPPDRVRHLIPFPSAPDTPLLPPTEAGRGFPSNGCVAQLFGPAIGNHQRNPAPLMPCSANDFGKVCNGCRLSIPWFQVVPRTQAPPSHPPCPSPQSKTASPTFDTLFDTYTPIVFVLLGVLVGFVVETRASSLQRGFVVVDGGKGSSSVRHPDIHACLIPLTSRPTSRHSTQVVTPSLAFHPSTVTPSTP